MPQPPKWLKRIRAWINDKPSKLKQRLENTPIEKELPIQENKKNRLITSVLDTMIEGKQKTYITQFNHKKPLNTPDISANTKKPKL